MTTLRLASILAGTPGPSTALASPAATSTTSSTVRPSPVTTTVRIADSLPRRGACPPSRGPDIDPERTRQAVDRARQRGSFSLVLVARRERRRGPPPRQAAAGDEPSGALPPPDGHAQVGSLADRCRLMARLVWADAPAAAIRVCPRARIGYSSERTPYCSAARGRGSVGRASPCQGEGRGFESRRPLGGARHRHMRARRPLRPFGSTGGSRRKRPLRRSGRVA